MRCPHATTASWHASPADKTGSSSHAWLHPVAQLVTFNVALSNGDVDVAVSKLGEVRNDVRDVVVVIIVLDPPVGAAGRRSKTPEAGALKTPVSK